MTKWSEMAWQVLKVEKDAAQLQIVITAVKMTLDGPMGKIEIDSSFAAKLGLTRIFPSPERLVGQDIAALGMPRARGAALEALAVAEELVGFLGSLPTKVD